tara:strand:+ start:29 stop:418 length:390 start_codon:yes stop_codon:yes gene_type:complete
MVEQMENLTEMTPIQIKEYHSVFPDPDEKDRLCIRIEKGPFAGLGIAYGKFQLSDKENDDGTTKVRYEYDMIEIPPDMKDKEFSDDEGEMLESILGQVYIHILNEELEQQKEVSEDGKTRKYDFTKPVV